MASPSVTRASLLLRIRDPRDKLAWGAFVELYAPLVHAYGLHHGLQDADAADLVQDVLRQVSRSVPKFEYDRSRGSFRGWLFTVTRNELRKAVGRQGRQPRGSGDSQVQGLLAEHADGREDDTWDREYQRRLFDWAAERVKAEFRDNSWRAFWLSVVEGREIDAVAAELKMSVGAIYVARSRVTARIRQEIAACEE